MSDNGFRYPLEVRFFEVDSLGVVFNMWYLGWCDEAMSAYMESIGYGYATLRAAGLDAVYNDGDYNTALSEFEAAYKAHPSPGVLYNVGLTQKALFRYPEAIVGVTVAAWWQAWRWYL